MDVLISMTITFIFLVFSVYNRIFVGYPLLLGLIIFTLVAWRRGFSRDDIIRMSINGAKKAIIVLSILLLIGGITGIWMASGTVPAIIFYGLKYMNPHFFILSAFLICCFVSFLLGTSFGSISTIGVALILIAKNGGVDLNLAAGAIIAGSYFGDRCSPMSSSASLIASLTETNLYKNIKNMFITSAVPFMLSVIIYLILSLKMPLQITNSSIGTDILEVFNLNWIALLPAISIVALSIFRVDVKINILVSIILASIIAITVQHYNIIEILKFILLGFDLDSQSTLRSILKGGGIISMWQAALVVLISCTLSGIFDGTNMLKRAEDLLMKTKSRFMLFIYTSITSFFTAAFGCSQTLSIVLTTQLMKSSYEELKIDKYELASDIENTSVLLSALVPWCVAALVPTTTLGVSSSGYIPFAFYIYLIPLTNALWLKISSIRRNNTLLNNKN